MDANGKTKALTFSYDDGVESDRKLVSILNKYGMKCTFNLNSGLMTRASNWNYNGFQVFHINATAIGDLYAGHEIASHTLTHADLIYLDDDTVSNEILTDRKHLQSMFGQPIRGMAYPVGYYDERVEKIAGQCGILYARTTVSTHSFGIPDDLLAYHPTCHHDDEDLFELAKRFLELETETPQVFYVWGHSYEFDGKKNWDRLERFCELMAGRQDIDYCTNSEALLRD